MKADMDAILALCENFLAARSDQTSSIDGINPCGGDNAIPIHESPIAKFCSLVSENVCDGVELTIPRKVLETVNVDNVLKESITIGIPLFYGSGFSKEIVHVEHEWKPPCCEQCKIFGYVYDQCPKNATVVHTIEMNNDGFQTMVNKRRSGKNGLINNNRSVVNVAPNVSTSAKDGRTKQPTKAIDIPLSSSAKKGESEEEVEVVFDESYNLLNRTKKGFTYTAPDDPKLDLSRFAMLAFFSLVLCNIQLEL
ncbi:hypothetical protein Tco_1098282 [Tanacetum coccineum]